MGFLFAWDIWSRGGIGGSPLWRQLLRPIDPEQNFLQQVAGNERPSTISLFSYLFVGENNLPPLRDLVVKCTTQTPGNSGQTDYDQCSNMSL
jgi:hypothetical protein